MIPYRRTEGREAAAFIDSYNCCTRSRRRSLVAIIACVPYLLRVAVIDVTQGGGTNSAADLLAGTILFGADGQSRHRRSRGGMSPRSSQCRLPRA
eukprot:2553711-Pyramimonas_sp.AAC.2